MNAEVVSDYIFPYSIWMDCPKNNGKHLIELFHNTELVNNGESDRKTTVIKRCILCNREFGVVEVIDNKQMIGDQGE